MSDSIISMPLQAQLVFGKTEQGTNVHCLRLFIVGSFANGQAKAIFDGYIQDALTNEIKESYEVEQFDLKNEEDLLKVEVLATKKFRQLTMKTMDFYYDNYAEHNPSVRCIPSEEAFRVRLSDEKRAGLELGLTQLNIKDRQLMMEVRETLFNEAKPKVYEEMWGSW